MRHRLTRGGGRRPAALALLGLCAGAVLLTPGIATADLTSAAAPAPARDSAGGLPYQDPSLPTERRVDDLLSRMTLAEKVGQMTQAERGAVAEQPSRVRDWKLGSLLSGGGSTPGQNTPEAWADMVDGFQRHALGTRLGIPLLYGVDAVHGHGNLHGATVFPHNIGLGATRNPGLVRRIAHITAKETRASGPQWNFAPCLCPARDDRWGRTYETFGEDPTLVQQMAVAIDGYQGRGASKLDEPDRVLATAKHFAGDGLTRYGTGNGDYTIDQGTAVSSREDFWRLAVSPFVPAIRQHDVGSVMPSFSSVDWTEDGVGNPIKMHAHKQLLTGVLKNRLGFDGFVVSDWEAIHQLPGDYAEQVRTAINAGVDMAMEPNSADRFIETLTAEVEAGRVMQTRIDDAVRRILTSKFELGLFEKPYTDRRNLDQIGSPAHRSVAREAVAQSQVLLKNRRGTLPLRTTRNIYVAGSNADNVGNQAGGWTLTWQGGSTNEVPGTSILDGIRRQASGDVIFSEDASTPIDRRDLGIVVVGETPYSEGFGDVGGPRWAYDPGDEGTARPVKDMQLSKADRAAVDRVCAAARRCVVVVVSGRPMILEPARLRGVDALVAAWLPGSEGAGVVDTLFGRQPFTAKLPVTWPRSLDQEPINVGDADYDPLYPYGYGLTTRVSDDGRHHHD